MIDAAITHHFMLSRCEWKLTQERAKVRALEAVCGVSETPTGEFWLERVHGFEYEHAEVLSVLREFGPDPRLAKLAELAARLESLQAPACRTGDHQVAA